MPVGIGWTGVPAGGEGVGLRKDERGHPEKRLPDLSGECQTLLKQTSRVIATAATGGMQHGCHTNGQGA